MNFPHLIDIATKNVVTIDENKSLNDAVVTMQQHNIRDIIITRKGSHHYGLITANDLIRFKIERVEFNAQIKELKVDQVSTIGSNATLLDAFKEIQDTCHCLCVIDDNEELCGFINYTDIIGSLDPTVLIKEQKIKDMLWNNKIKHVSVDAQTCEALRMMSNIIYDSVIVYDKDKAVGIITTKDTIRLLSNGSDLSRPISDYMSSPIHTIDENTSIQETLSFIQKENFKRVIVSNKEGIVVGQISQQELLSKVYSRWAEGLKDHGKELEEINKMLEARASKFEEMAQIDVLTGLANRSSFEEKMVDELERIERYQSQAFSVIFFDIDHFKNINDTYGHLVGDHVLQSISTQCKSLLRINDMLARWGGEEFVAILPMVEIEGAKLVAEKLRKYIEEYIFEQVGNITCSFGVSQYQEGDTPTALLHRADNAMYEAKKAGRNRVILA
ncbi:diguanylate cyclase [Campylobacterota bacterium]